MRRRTPDSIALILVITAVAASAWTASAIGERLPHLEDEIAFLWEAEVMAEGKIDLPSPAYPRSFLMPFVVDHAGRRFGKYPPGWPAALSLGVRAGAAWLVNPLLAGAAVWLVYRLGSRFGGSGIGLLAAFLAGTSPMLLMLSGTYMGHNLSLVLAAAFALAWLDLFLPAAGAGPQGRLPPALLVLVGGLSLGLLALTRPLTAVGVALPAAIHAMGLLVRGGRRRRTQVLLIAALALVVTSLLLIWQAALTGDPLQNPYTLWWDYDRVGFGPGHGHTPDGHTLRQAWINTEHSLRAGLHDLFGWPYLSWLFLPLGILALRKRGDAWFLAGVLPSLVLVYGAYWIGSWLFGPRYYVEALPGMAVLSAAGIAWAGGWMTAAPRWARARRAILSALVLLLLAANLLVYLPIRLGGLRGLYGISRDRLEAFEAVAPERGLVIVHPAEVWTEYGALLTLSPPFADGEMLLAYSRGPDQDARLADLYAPLPAFHYYVDQPDRLYSSPRDGETPSP